MGSSRLSATQRGSVIVAGGTNYFLIPPRYTFAIGQSVDTLQWFILIVVGVLVSALLESRLKDRDFYFVVRGLPL